MEVSSRFYVTDLSKELGIAQRPMANAIVIQWALVHYGEMRTLADKICHWCIQGARNTVCGKPDAGGAVAPDARRRGITAVEPR